MQVKREQDQCPSYSGMGVKISGRKRIPLEYDQLSFSGSVGLTNYLDRRLVVDSPLHRS